MRTYQVHHIDPPLSLTQRSYIQQYQVHHVVNLTVTAIVRGHTNAVGIERREKVLLVRLPAEQVMRISTLTPADSKYPAPTYQV